ncbi:MAG: glycosyltransferase family 39 protein [Elusimicrobiales bacterium]|nr:glycosyltransferase family 39 protein [Elusimicrobiales bacterium]
MAQLQQKLVAFMGKEFPRRVAFALAASAFILNIASCWDVYRHEPLREAASRSLFAANSSFFFDSGLAEPVPVFALKAAMAFGADPDAALRVEGLIVFALLGLVTMFCVRRRLGETAGVMAGLFLGANPYFGYYAIQGASHLYALLFLVLFWYYFDVEGGGRREALLAGLAGGLACLSRLDSAWVLLLIAVFSWVLRRGAFGLKRAALSLGLALLLTAPYLAWQQAKYSNLFYAQELSLRRWSNIDSYGYAPGAPYQAAPLGAAGFVFRNGAAGATRSFFSGLGRAFAYELPRAVYYKFLFVLIFLGVYAAVTLKKDPPLFFLAAALLPVLPLADIKQVPAAGGIELRYYLAAVWALFALAGLGFQEILAWLERTLARAAAKK